MNGAGCAKFSPEPEMASRPAGIPDLGRATCRRHLSHHAEPGARRHPGVPWRFPEVAALLAQRGVTAAGPPFARYQVDADTFHVTAGIPVPNGVEGSGQVRLDMNCPAAISRQRCMSARELPAAFHAVIEWLPGPDTCLVTRGALSRPARCAAASYSGQLPRDATHMGIRCHQARTDDVPGIR